MWEELPQDVQLVIVWKAVRTLITPRDEHVVPWRTAERVQLINRLFHSRARAVVRMLSAIKFVYKERQIAERFCKSSILVAESLLNDLHGTDRANRIMELTSAVYTMVWGRIGRLRHLENDDPNAVSLRMCNEVRAVASRVYDERRGDFQQNMRDALFAGVLFNLKHRQQTNDPNYKALLSFVGKAFAYVYKEHEPEAMTLRQRLDLWLA